MNPPTLVSLDPSSTAIGWAWFRGGVLCDSGVDRVPDVAVADKLNWSWKTLDRICFKGQIAVIEIPGNRTGPRSGGAMVRYAMFVGLAIGYAYSQGMDVHLVTPEEWTGGQPKPRRAMITRAMYPDLDWSKDKGHDMADAIGLGQWWLAQQRIREATAV